MHFWPPALLTTHKKEYESRNTEDAKRQRATPVVMIGQDYEQPRRQGYSVKRPYLYTHK
jgi:hypothetical protein